MFLYYEKNLSPNEPPGWKWYAWFMLSGYSGDMSMVGWSIALVDGHPGTKRLEIFQVEKLPVQPLGIMGSAVID